MIRKLQVEQSRNNIGKASKKKMFVMLVIFKETKSLLIAEDIPDGNIYFKMCKHVNFCQQAIVVPIQTFNIPKPPLEGKFALL